MIPVRTLQAMISVIFSQIPSRCVKLILSDDITAQIMIPVIFMQLILPVKSIQMINQVRPKQIHTSS